MTKPNAEHTPLPWSVVPDYSGEGRGYVAGPDRIGIVMTPPGRHRGSPKYSFQADAEFIVRACNAHDDLLAAASDALACLESDVASDCPWCEGEGSWTDENPPRMVDVRHKGYCAIVSLRAALARAEPSATPTETPESGK